MICYSFLSALAVLSTSGSFLSFSAGRHILSSYFAYTRVYLFRFCESILHDSRNQSALRYVGLGMLTPYSVYSLICLFLCRLLHLALRCFDCAVNEAVTFAVSLQKHSVYYIRPDDGVSATKHLWKYFWRFKSRGMFRHLDYCALTDHSTVSIAFIFKFK